MAAAVASAVSTAICDWKTRSCVLSFWAFNIPSTTLTLSVLSLIKVNFCVLKVNARWACSRYRRISASAAGGNFIDSRSVLAKLITPPIESGPGILAPALASTTFWKSVWSWATIDALSASITPASTCHWVADWTASVFFLTAARSLVIIWSLCIRSA